MNRKERISLILVVILVSFALGVQQGFTWEGYTSSWSPGYFEEQYINATTEFYRDGDNYTAWIDDNYLSDDGSEPLTTTTINATTEFYRNGENYTAWIDGLYPHVPAPQTRDYLIAPRGAGYTAYYGNNQSVIFSDTRAHNVIEWIMGNDTDGGRIAFTPGEFTIGEYLDLDACESGWVSDDADVTVTHDAAVKVEGANSTKMVVAGGFGTGLMAHKQLPATINGSAGDVIIWWARGTVDIGSNKLSLKIDDANDCSSPYPINIEWFHTENLGSNEWKMIQGPSQTYYWGVPLILTSATTINSVGVYADADPGAVTLYLDDIDIGIGVIKIDDGQAWTFSGAGMNQTILTLADGANMPVFYVTADEARIEKMSIDGGVQSAIDGCGGIFFHYSDNVMASEIYVYNIKGAGIKFRELSHGDAFNCRGYNIENPFIGGSFVEYIRALGGTSELITNDDHYWFSSGSDHVEIGNFKIKTASGGIRFSGGSGEFHDINIHDGTIEDMSLQFIQIDEENTSGVVINNVWANNSDEVGFRIAYIYDFRVTNCRVGFTKRHGMVFTGCNQGYVGHNIIESANYDDAGSYDGIRHSAHQVVFEANIFTDYSHGGGNASMHRSIKEEGTPEDIYYAFNQLLTHTYQPAITVVASDSEFFGNIGMVTENYGSETITGGQWVDFAHDLYGTPEVVLAGFNDTIEWSWTATSTNVNITVDTAGNYVVAWFAKSDPTI